MADSNNDDLGAEAAVKEEPESPKPVAAAADAPAKQQRAPRKPRVKKTPVEAQQPPPAPQVENDPVRDNPRFFVELTGTLKDMIQEERRVRLSTMKIV